LQQPLIYIQTTAAFQQFKEGVKGCLIVGIDTEFDRTRTYWPDLCLLQIATPQAVFVIEPSAFDLSWLTTFMADPTITKIFHSCRQDLEAFYALSGRIPQNVFDTQVAAVLVGMTDQISYADLCKNLLQLDLCKDFQWSNWAARPLLTEQISYAADDARYLIRLHESLQDQLEAIGRQELMRRIMEAYEDKSTYQKDARRYFMNKIHHSSMPLEHAYALYQLTEWREQYCQTHNVMRRLVFEDKDLLDPNMRQDDKFKHLYSTAVKAEEIPPFLKAQHMGHPLKAIQTKIRSTLAGIGIPLHYVVTQNMMIDFLLYPSHDTNPLFNTWRYTLIEPCIDKLLMIKSKFQA
jgi:ribonuclease D